MVLKTLVGFHPVIAFRQSVSNNTVLFSLRNLRIHLNSFHSFTDRRWGVRGWSREEKPKLPRYNFFISGITPSDHPHCGRRLMLGLLLDFLWKVWALTEVCNTSKHHKLIESSLALFQWGTLLKYYSPLRQAVFTELCITAESATV